MALGESRTSPISADVKRDPATPRSAEPPFGCNMSFEPWQLLLSIVAGWIHDEQQKIIEYQRTIIQVLQEKNGKKRILLNDDQRRRLAVKGKALGRKLLSKIGTFFTPDTILRWHRELVAQKWDHSDKRRSVGRPPTPREAVDLILKFARENPTWGYDRIADALANLGHKVSDQTVGRHTASNRPGVKNVPISLKSLRPKTFPLTAKRRRWSSLSKI